jgi:tetratricopeptide (TPR) repeat protein
MIQLFRGDCDKAIGPLERGLVTDRLSDIPLLFPLVAAPLGWAYALTGRHDEGLRLLEEAIERAEAMEWAANHAIRLLWLGRAHLLAGHGDIATRLGLRALELARRLGERGHEAYALQMLGDLAGKAVPPDVERRSEHYRAALTLAEALGMRPLAAAIASSLP